MRSGSAVDQGCGGGGGQPAPVVMMPPVPVTQSGTQRPLTTSHEFPTGQMVHICFWPQLSKA
jgi:hypothetical protein